MIVFSDMDGTFLTSTKEVSPLAWRALDEMAAHGYEFVPCTGRPLVSVYPEILAHPAVHYAVCANGASVYQVSDDGANPVAIYEAPLARDKALQVLEIARPHDVTFDVFADGNCYTNRAMYDRLDEYAGDPFILESLRRSRTPVDEQPEESIARVHMLERVSMYWYDPNDRDAILAGLRDVDDINVTRSYSMNIEVMGNGVCKGTALAWLCSHLGIDVADAIAFGDNINDIEMLQVSGLGVAVANAEPEVREAADLVAATNDEDGVAHVILDQLAARERSR